MTKTYRLYSVNSDNLQESLEDLLEFLHRRAGLIGRVARVAKTAVDLTTNEISVVLVVNANDVCPQHIITALFQKAFDVLAVRILAIMHGLHWLYIIRVGIYPGVSFIKFLAAEFEKFTNVFKHGFVLTMKPNAFIPNY